MAEMLSPPPMAEWPGAEAMAIQIAFVPYSVEGSSKTPSGPLAKTVAAESIVDAYRSTVLWPMSTMASSTGSASTSISNRCPPCTDATSTGVVDLVAMSIQQFFRHFDPLPQTTFSDEIGGGSAELDPASEQQDLADESAAQHLIGDAILDRRPQHEKGIVDLRTTKHEDEGPCGILTKVAESCVLSFEESTHRRGKHLLEADERGLRPVYGRECVTDVEIGQRRQLAHQERACLLDRFEVELRLEECELLGEKADVVEQEHLAIHEGGDGVSGSGSADVVDEADRAVDLLGEGRGMRLGRGVVVILEIPSLVSQQHEPGPPVAQLLYRGRAGADTRGIRESPGLPVQRRVDVDSTDDGLPCGFDIVERPDPVAHRSVLLAQTKVLVGQADGLEPIVLQLKGRAYPIDGLGRDHSFLRDVDGKHELSTAHRDRLLEDGDLVHVGTLVAEVPGVAEQSRIRVEPIRDPHDANARVCFEELDGRVLSDGLSWGSR